MESPLVTLCEQVVTSPFTSSQTAQPVVTVDNGDSQVPGQCPELEPFSGARVDRETSFPGPGDASSHVGTPRHPNALPLRRDLA
jgi:hypothetical protein